MRATSCRRFDEQHELPVVAEGDFGDWQLFEWWYIPWSSSGLQVGKSGNGMMRAVQDRTGQDRTGQDRIGHL
jgi:hypothetical protein